jgi:protein-L-isoaspartate(D-aspartate) O-methyltransferase
MGQVPREEFVPAELVGVAYEDRALPIGQEQTISQPYTVAFMCDALALSGGEKVLEIGTGSGYGAAVLSLLGRDVHTVERIVPLCHAARDCLSRLGYTNVHVHLGDGTLGWPESAPYDAIVVTAGAPKLPAAYSEQLAEGGRIVIPMGAAPWSQHMWRFKKSAGRLRGEDLGAFAFVPLVGQCGWDEAVSRGER